MKLTLWLLLILVFTCLGFGGGYLVDHSYKVYEGIEVLDSPNERSIFSDKIAFESRGIRRTEIVSEAPLVVDFEVTFANGIDFPFGEVHYDKQMRILLTIYGCFITALIAGIIIWKD